MPNLLPPNLRQNRGAMLSIGALVALVTSFLPKDVWAGGGGNGEGLGLVSAIGLAVVAASVLAVLFSRIKIPALLAYICAGLALGLFAGSLFGDSVHTMEHISHLGLVFLLFIIGLEMDLGGIFKLGPRVAFAMLLQAPIAIGVVYGIQWALFAADRFVPGLGVNPESWIFYAVACSLGSTAVVVKLLGDKFDLGSQAGKITVLTLIAEDIWAVAALSYVKAQASGPGESASPLMMLGGGALLAAAFVVFARYILSRVMAYLASSPDLLSLVSLGWCFLCAEGMSKVGLSAEMGALIAGLTIGRLPQHTEVLAKVSSLRDFFMALFFVALGITLPPPTLAILGQASCLVLIVIVVRMLLYSPTLFAAKLGPIVSLAAPINLAQLSEFSLLIVPIGVASGALNVQDSMVVSYALMLSVVISTFSIKYNYQIAIFLARLLRSDARDNAKSESEGAADGHGHGADIVFLGFFLNAEAIAQHLHKADSDLRDRMLVIDFNLQNHERIKGYGLRVAYGDISNPETLRHHGIGSAKVIVSTISNAFLRGISNEDLIAQVKQINPRAKFIATAVSASSADEFVAAGASDCVSPPEEACPAYVEAIEKALSRAEAEAASEEAQAS